MAERRAVLELRAGDAGALRVLSVSGEEALSEPFRFDVEFEREDGATVDLAALLGADASLAMRWQDGEGRDVHGVIDRAELLSLAAGRARHRVRIVPRLALLSRRGGFRVHQGKSAPDVAAAVLEEGGVPARFSLRAGYPPREHCVQWDESDLAFVTRLLAEEGISYRFEHGPGAHELVALDAPGDFVDAPGEPLPFRPPDEAAEGSDEHVARLSAVRRVRTGTQALRDFDELHPELKVEGEARASGAPALEAYEYRLAYADAGELARLAAERLEAARVPASTVEGEAVSLRLAPGVRIELAEHPDAALNGAVQILRVVHEARQAGMAAGAGGGTFTYGCRFLAQPAGDPIRPPRPPPRPLVRGPQSAVVVGPAGEEIHADEHGRIKIQLRWDRDGAHDDRSSAFVRVAQPWAGPGQGTLRLPRAGQEVLVRFLGGDPDRPLVVGAVYHGTNRPPLSLPAERTQSTLRSDSSPGSGGSNELRLEDAAGAEEVFVHAQRDLAAEVERDESRRVGHESALAVGKDRVVEVGRDHDLRVGALDRAQVDGSQTLTVAGGRRTAVGAGHVETVGGSASVAIGGAQAHVTALASTVTVGAAASLAVGGALAVVVGAAATVTVGGALESRVAGERREAVGGARSERVDGAAERKVSGDEELEVKDGAVLRVEQDLDERVDGKVGIEAVEPAALLGKKLRIEADELCLEVGGKVLLSMKKSGDVAFAASAFTVKADGDLVVKGQNVKKEAAGSAASGSAAVAELEARKAGRGVAKVTLASRDGAPLAGVRFRAELPDGSVVEGSTDGAGNAAIPSAKDGDVKITLPDLDRDSWSTG